MLPLSLDKAITRLPIVGALVNSRLYRVFWLFRLANQCEPTTSHTSDFPFEKRHWYYPLPWYYVYWALEKTPVIDVYRGKGVEQKMVRPIITLNPK